MLMERKLNNAKELLAERSGNVLEGRTKSLRHARAFPKGLSTRLSRLPTPPVIFDLRVWEQQCLIQTKLHNIFPQFKDIICSKPATDGYLWKVGDYIDLYYDHYTLVIRKIRKLIANAS